MIKSNKPVAKFRSFGKFKDISKTNNETGYKKRFDDLTLKNTCNRNIKTRKKRIS